MKSWQPITNGGKFYAQFQGNYVMHEDSRGQYVTYRSLTGARKAAGRLNRLMLLGAKTLTQEAHLNGDTSDVRLVTLFGDRR